MPVDAGDQVAGLDTLVVGDGHLGDVARHLRGDGDGVRLDECIVGRLEVAGIVPEHVTGDREEDRKGGADQEQMAMAPQEALVALLSGVAGVVLCEIFRRIVLPIRQRGLGPVAVVRRELRRRIVPGGRPFPSGCGGVESGFGPFRATTSAWGRSGARFASVLMGACCL